jgi:presenilin-like A22 family membrane protease
MNKRGKKFGDYSPEISLAVTQVLAGYSFYLVVIKKSESWLFTTLAVSAALGFINVTVLLYSLRPAKSYNRKLATHGPGFAWSVAFLLLLLTGATLMVPALLLHNPLGAAIMILSFGAGWSFFFCWRS